MSRYIKCINDEIIDIKPIEFDDLIKYCYFYNFNPNEQFISFVPYEKRKDNVKFIGIFVK